MPTEQTEQRLPVSQDGTGRAKRLPVLPTIDKATASQPLTLVLIALLSGAFGTYYWTSSAKADKQHDEIIRLQTLLEVSERKNGQQDSLIDQAMNRAVNAEKANVSTNAQFETFALMFGIKNAPKLNFNAIPMTESVTERK